MNLIPHHVHHVLSINRCSTLQKNRDSSKLVGWEKYQRWKKKTRPQEVTKKVRNENRQKDTSRSDGRKRYILQKGS